METEKFYRSYPEFHRLTKLSKTRGRAQRASPFWIVRSKKKLQFWIDLFVEGFKFFPHVTSFAVTLTFTSSDRLFFKRRDRQQQLSNDFLQCMSTFTRCTLSCRHNNVLILTTVAFSFNTQSKRSRNVWKTTTSNEKG